jgi:glutamine amidotransferase
MIGIIDYGMGNVGSIVNMLKKIGAKGETCSNPTKLQQYEKLILPGVGAFDNAMKKLNELNFSEAIKEYAQTGKPLLGICLGMQLLADGSEEGELPGLGLIPGQVLKFQHTDLAIPHMGWNTVTYKSSEPLFQHFQEFEESRFYFVHSYFFKCDKEENIMTTTHYGHDFTSGVKTKNVFGAQFHPEKSHLFGIQMFKNFVNL